MKQWGGATRNLVPSKIEFAILHLGSFGITRIRKWGDRRVLPPFGDLHRIECWLLHHGLHLKIGKGGETLNLRRLAHI